MAEKAAKAENDTSKPIIAAILNLIIPGLGHWYIGSKFALQYFGGAVAVWIVTMGVGVVTLGLCFPIFLLPLVWSILSIVDVYYEATGEMDKRLLKQYIK